MTDRWAMGIDWVPCAIGLGSNLGNSKQTLEDSLHALCQVDGIILSARSKWYLTKPFGPPQPNYWNGCALLRVKLTPLELLDVLLAVELQFGRVRLGKNQPRTLDLDLLLFGDRIIDTPNLQVPHPRMGDRAFVLVPLAEVAPEWRDPTTGQTILELAGLIDGSDVLAVDLDAPE